MNKYIYICIFICISDYQMHGRSGRGGASCLGRVGWAAMKWLSPTGRSHPDPCIKTRLVIVDLGGGTQSRLDCQTILLRLLYSAHPAILERETARGKRGGKIDRTFRVEKGIHLNAHKHTRMHVYIHIHIHIHIHMHIRIHIHINIHIHIHIHIYVYTYTT